MTSLREALASIPGVLEESVREYRLSLTRTIRVIVKRDYTQAILLDTTDGIETVIAQRVTCVNPYHSHPPRSLSIIVDELERLEAGERRNGKETSEG